jgi:hypothetical protein
MDAYTIKRWERIRELTDELELEISIYDYFELLTKEGMSLGIFKTVDELYAFVCGYEHYASYIKNTKET